jgi:hypothetical protein
VICVCPGSRDSNAELRVVVIATLCQPPFRFCKAKIIARQTRSPIPSLHATLALLTLFTSCPPKPAFHSFSGSPSLVPPPRILQSRPLFFCGARRAHASFFVLRRHSHAVFEPIGISPAKVTLKASCTHSPSLASSPLTTLNVPYDSIPSDSPTHLVFPAGLYNQPSVFRSNLVVSHVDPAC